MPTGVYTRTSVPNRANTDDSEFVPVPFLQTRTNASNSGAHACASFRRQRTKVRAAKGLPYTLISLLAGWWGIPWGPIWTVMTVVQNFAGGKDLTPAVLAALGTAIPLVNRPPPPLPPAEAAERAERASRRTLVQRLAFVVLAIVIMFGIYAAYKIVKAGAAASKQPGAAELRQARSLIASGGARSSANNAKATQLAEDMSKLMEAHREKNFSHAAKKFFMDEGDEFRTYCYLQ